MSSAHPSSPPPSLFDTTTVVSLLFTVAILLAALALSRAVLDPVSTPPRLRALFVWHAFDALIHFVLEGGFVYHCLFSVAPAPDSDSSHSYWPDPKNFLGRFGGGGGAASEVMHGSQAGGTNPLAQLWMVYAKADARWAGVDPVGFFCPLLVM